MSLERVKTYWAATERLDWPTAGSCIGPGYTWVDYATGVVASSAEELAEALADEQPWSNVRFEIRDSFETPDHVLTVQAVRSGSVTGEWRSMRTTGQRIQFPLCTIFKFNEDDLIVSEEAYYDMAAVMRQLGYAPPMDS